MEEHVAEARDLLESLGYLVLAPEDFLEDASDSEAGDVPAILTPSASEYGSDEQAGDGDRTPRPSPCLSEFGSELEVDDAVFEAALIDLRLPPPAAPASEALHSSVDVDKLYPKDGDDIWDASVAQQKKESEVNEASAPCWMCKTCKEIAKCAVSMKKAANETVERLMPLVKVDVTAAEDEEESSGYGENLGPLLDQYASNIDRFVSWLDKKALPVMQARKYEIVGGLEGMVDRARTVGLFDEHGVPEEIVGALHGGVLILETLETDVDILELVDPGFVQHRAILNALRSCLESLE